jgi:hypothetical protein
MCVLERGVFGVFFLVLGGTWLWEMGFPPEQFCYSLMDFLVELLCMNITELDAFSFLLYT